MVALLLLEAILLGVAVSMDGFSAGFAYGIRALKIPLISLLIIALSSAVSIMVSMLLGHALSSYLPLGIASIVGGSLLLVLGGGVIYTSVIGCNSEGDLFDARAEGRGSLLSLLRNPEKADLDKSGTISAGEAFILGGILATDAFAAGLGASLVGFPPVLTGFFVGLSKIVLVSAGLYLGRRSVMFVSSRGASLAAGLILSAMGLINIIT
ncbi:MAG: sporulation membrane protein YtaF [Firmicutes bacterium]|nr:sporulation membrane protein YtaF [Bacillota bacterium]